MYPREGESLGTRLVELHIVHCMCTWHRPSAVVDNVKCWHTCTAHDTVIVSALIINVHVVCNVHVCACYWYLYAKTMCILYRYYTNACTCMYVHVRVCICRHLQYVSLCYIYS